MNKFKIKYIPGFRPVPMLALYNEKNIKVFNEIKKNSNINRKISFNQEYVNKYNHYWNHGSYIIYDDSLNVIALVYEQLPTLFYILRSINKELIFEIDAINENEIINELGDWINEVSFIEKNNNE
ncbi:MAG: hypothetical protein ACRDCD_00165 [Mycoplasmoidaceae bacterium]